MTLIGNKKCAILFYLIADMFCGSNEKKFACKNNQLIDEAYFCYQWGGICRDRSDESYGCDRSRCVNGNFACNDTQSQCVPISARCNAKRDCIDGSDELYCDKGYFQCKNGSLIGGDWFCDRERDCADNSDESYGCSVDHCGRALFTCRDSGQECIPISLRCNGNKDCPDGSDEMNCGNGYFQCTDGRLIGSVQFCDGKPNCADGSDESYGCSIYHCGIAQFTCNDEQCLPISVRCDGKPDCADGSDEIHCGHAFNSKNCLLQEGKYLCKDRSGCIPLANVCDGINGCLDGSEENITCHDATDTCDLSCPHPCWRSPNGPLCFCNATDGSNQSLCNKVEDCDLDEDVCEQRCVKFDGAIQCSCNEGYTQPDVLKGSCVSKVPQENALLYWDERNMVGYDMTTRQKIFIQNENNVTSISGAHSYIYWSSFSNNASKIFRTKLLYQRREETIYSDPRSTSAITCIAVDWMTNNTFFTSQTTLSVCNENGSVCVQLKHTAHGIECVSLLPRKGFMFWIENMEDKYNKARILKSSMDGSDQQILVDENLHFSNHLVADESSERIYWIDRESARIESIKYNGKQRKIVLPRAASITYFTVFEGIVYYALKGGGSIFNGAEGEVWLKGESNIRKIHIFNPLLQQTKISNPCALSSCPGLCLLRPASLPPSLNFTCLYEHSKADMDDDDASTPSNSTSKVRGWSSNTTTPPINCNKHFPTTTEKETRIGHAIEVHGTPEQQLSTFGNDVKILLVILIVVLILSLCVNTIFSLYDIRLKTKRARLIINDDLINLESQ